MEKILILDFGGQYCHLISRRIRDFGIYAEVVPSNIKAAEIKQIAETKKGLKKGSGKVKGIILSGGAMSVFDKKSPSIDKKILDLNIPILGICYGHQIIAHILGGKVDAGKAGEYGPTKINLNSHIKRETLKNEKSESASLFSKVKNTELVWMNHRDIVRKAPTGFDILATSEGNVVAALGNAKKKIYSVQFHPEVSHTKCGDTILKNFAINICKSKKEWSSKHLVTDILKETSETISGNQKAIIGLSGGIDSTVAAFLVSKAIGKRLIAVYVDTGMMRYKETEYLREAFKNVNVKLKVVYAGDRFFTALKGVTEPERKRKIIGKLFADIFSEEAKKEKADFLIQGTIYSDRIESGITKHSSKIKSHHNVGGLPKNLKLKVYEPLRDLYKDEVRKIARHLKISPVICERQVFPGPGNAIRVLGEVTPEKVEIVRQATHIVESELRNTKYWSKIWMSFAVLLPVKSVGVQGDERSYKYPIVLRIVESRDAMTANFSKLPWDILETISNRITNEIKDVNRVVYDVTHKPPATMEWE